MFSKIILGSYEANSYTIDAADHYLNYKDCCIDTIDTAISYDNASLLSDLIKDHELKVISKIAPQMTSHASELITMHRKELESPIDLMLIHNNRCDWLPIAKELIQWKSDGLVNEIGVSNFSVEDLITYNNTFGFYPSYNEFEVNPLYTPSELILFCKAHNIKTIGYCVLGGKYNADRLIKYYTLCGLVNYAAQLVDHVIVRSDNINHIKQFSDSLNSNNSIKIESELDKVMIPMNYQTQKYMSKHNNRVYYQNNSICDSCIDMDSAVKEVYNYKDYQIEQKFFSDCNDLEFITDIRVLFKLYEEYAYHPNHSTESFIVNGKEVNIYIIDTDNKLSKVYKPGYTILVKAL